jgi:hypothetical protein
LRSNGKEAGIGHTGRIKSMGQDVSTCPGRSQPSSGC